jgi:DNA anti-recombination protein RmuC
LLDGFLGGRRSRRSLLGSVAGKRRQTQASGARLDAAENKIQLLHQQLDELEQGFTEEVQTITDKWDAVAADITTASVALERTDVKVTQMALVWLPVP